MGCIILINIPAHSQNFDTELKKLAEEISNRINTKKKSKVAVWGFVTENGESTGLGNYITEDFAVYVTNFGENFEVIDRNHLEVILKEHQLNADGYIDETTAKELGKILAVDAIITGTYTVLTNAIKVRAKVLDTQTALQFAASIGNLPLDENVNAYLGLSNNAGKAANRGFTRPLNSKESINNPDTVDSQCQEKKFGDVCFFNSTKTKLIVVIQYNAGRNNVQYRKDIFLDPNETKCYFKIPDKIINYYVAHWDVFKKNLEGEAFKLTTRKNLSFLLDKGELKIESCTSKTFTVK